ncbi:hypothetical protein ACLB2K_071466 [Fragaria x ananassa]
MAMILAIGPAGLIGFITSISIRAGVYLLVYSSAETESSVSLEIVNNCSYTIWPGVLSTGTVNLLTTGFRLESGASFNLSDVPESWKGHVWGRTLCNQSSTGNFSCFTADCGTGKIECEGNRGKQPATLAEISLNITGGMDYDVNIENGFNLPMVVEPRGAGSSNCKSSGCSADLNGECPGEKLKVAREGNQETVACMSPCMAYDNDPQYCCSGQYTTYKCEGAVYTEFFKQKCPQAYVDQYGFIPTCASANYRIVFCPASLNQAPAEEPTPAETPAEEPTPSEQVKKSKKHKIIIASIASSAGIIILILAVLSGLWNSKRKRQQGIRNSSLVLEDGRRFTYSELVKITNNFASPIGAGGFGKVYHGILENDIQVAVKLLISASGSSEFQNEVKLLMRAHHRNVVSFTGYCNDGKTMALVFEYVANGNLRQHLTFSDVATGNILTWKERLQIAVDAAHGLDYLHNDCKPPIIHRDIKTSNILLTEKMQAKICDFGVSKLLSTETATHTMTDHVRGTRGYFDPEYYTTGKLNKKSDIYSFGVVLLELISGRTAIITDVEPEPVHICQWVRPMFERRDIESILDSSIQAGTCNVSSAWKAVEIAMECVSSRATERPDINVVYKELKECLEIEVPPEIAKVPEVDESDGCSTSSSVSVDMTYRVDIVRDSQQLQLHNLARTSLHRLITKPVDHRLHAQQRRPKSWTGQVWGRTLCNQSSTGNFSCFTADCGTGKIECDRNGGSLPATLAEFSLNLTGGMDYYDVSLATGFNLPMVVEPHGAGSSNCSSSGCSVDLNGSCPRELRVAQTESASFEIVNNCNYTIWPGIISTNRVNLSTSGFKLESGAFLNLSVPNSWQGRVWGRTLCNEFSAGNFSCYTADCGTGKVECDGNGAIPPVTQAEFAFNSTNDLTLYDITLVDGFNLPMVVEPRGAASSNCNSSGCSADLNGACPSELRVAREGSQETVACKTPCAVFNNPRFCCTGEYSSPQTCGGTIYTDYFKQRCPQAYTYAFDDNQTTFTCVSANYSIVFCPIRLPAETPAKEPTVSEQVPSKSKNHTIMIASIASSAGIIIFMLAVVAGLWSSKRKRQQEIQNSSLELEDGRRFMYSELVKITNNFASPIGAGGFGKVYHGILENDIQVAVKLLISASGSSEFQNEVKLLMRAHHRNVVSFTGYCYDGKTMALVFEYVANGNLQQHLTASDVDTGNILTWKERLHIAVDAAHGLDYLHNDCKPPIIHRDIKTSNILLTEKMQAKICDFGVSKLLSTETATHTMTDHVRGTRGYFDPEYYTTGKLNKKSDIYSFGIVLLELITGRTAIITDVEPEPIHICRWVRPMFQRRVIESILDSRIQAGTYNVSSAWKAVEIAMECVSSTATERPDINVVYKELKECLEIEVPPEIAKVPEVDESDDCSTSSSVYVHKTSYSESEIFSVHMKSPIECETDRHTC